jgi:protein SCO1/2
VSLALWTVLVACGDGSPTIGPNGPVAEVRGVELLGDYGQVPPFSLTDQSGEPFASTALAGRAWVADFFFTRCPDVCPLLTAKMAAVAGHYSAEPRVGFLSFSVDPANDSPVELAAYAARFSVDVARWRLLTGDSAAMRSVVVDGFKLLMERAPATVDKPETVLHGSRFVIIDARGGVRGYPDPDVPGEVERYVDAVLSGMR